MEYSAVAEVTPRDVMCVYCSWKRRN